MIKTNNNNGNPSSPPTRTSISPLPFVSPPPRAHRPSFSRRLRASTFLFPKTLSSPRMMIDNSGDDSKNNDDNKPPAGSSGGRTQKENIYSSSDHRTSACEGADGNRDHQPACNKGARGKTISNSGVIGSSNFAVTFAPNKPPAKKMVRFQDKLSIVVHHLQNVPVASQMTPREKARAWYTPSEHDWFKYDAAKHAGVKIVRYDSNSNEDGKGHHLVMMGDFDGREGAKRDYCSDGSNSGINKTGAAVASHKTGAAVSSDEQTSPAGKRYYNENEYRDSLESSEIICKRGLGYHFSRCRKHARIVTRSAVVAWQTTLNDTSNMTKVEQDLPSVGSSSMSGTTMSSNTSDGKGDGLEKEEKDRMMLALVSAKCSRVAREEARWRGDVDYRVAYPERHTATNSSKKGAVGQDGACRGDGSTKGGTKDNGSMARTTSGMKRAATGSGNHRNPSPVHSSSSPYCADQSNKRQRRNAATVGYLGGMLHAEV